jgi:hypothetical protein
LDSSLRRCACSNCFPRSRMRARPSGEHLPRQALGDERAPCQLGIAISQTLRLACLRLTWYRWSCDQVEQFRLCFVWMEAGPEEFEIVDVH